MVFYAKEILEMNHENIKDIYIRYNQSYRIKNDACFDMSNRQNPNTEKPLQSFSGSFDDVTFCKIIENDRQLYLKSLEPARICEFRKFVDILDNMTGSMLGFEFLLEWDGININEQNFLEKASNSITWFTLLDDIDPTKSNILERFSEKTTDKKFYTLLFRQALYGSCILKLYIGLIYNREILSRIIKGDRGERGKSINYLDDLLNCDYLRHIRNSLAHGTFDIFTGGIIFFDRNEQVFATPTLLTHLSNWLNIIMLQAMK
jgi:hypothetical protein